MMDTASNKFSVVFISYAKGKRTLKIKGTAPTRQEAEALRDGMYAKLFGEARNVTYSVLGPSQLKALEEQIKSEQLARRQKGVERAAETRKKNGPAAFICCPKCGAKSKKLYSEMGGLQTRVCQRGHRFEYDKWIADRAFWSPASVTSIYKTL